MKYTQDMVNKIDAQITKDLASGKSINQIEKEVRAKLEEMKPVKTPSVYNASRELVKIIEEADKLREKLQADKSKIDKNYKTEIRLQKERELESDYMTDLASLKFDLERVREKELKYKQEAIANNKLSPEYQMAKRDAFDVILTIGDKLEGDLVVELLKPIVEAKDLSTVRILSKMASKENNYAYLSAIRKTEEFINMDDTDVMIQDVSKYLSSNGKIKTYNLLNMIHKVKNN